MELEGPFLHVPVETLSRNLRYLKKQIDKAFEGMVSSVDNVLNKTTEEQLPPQLADCLTSVDQHLKQLESEVKQQHSEDAKVMGLLSKRLNFAKQLDSSSLDYETQELLNHQRLFRLLVVHLLREGYVDVGEKLTERTQISDLVDLEVFKTTKTIVAALSCGDCSEALKWCAENRKKLQKQKSTLEFNLNIQVFVELRRKGRLSEAIAHAKKNLTNCSKEQFQQVQRVLALLAFPENTTCQPYAYLYSTDRWKDLIQRFLTEYYISSGLTKESLLEIVMKAGLSALKTSCCFHEDTRNVNCPVCNEPYQSLSKELPFSHHVHSVLVCRLSGEIMDEHNPPMILPNGNVYSERALKDMAEKNEGKICDPQNGDVFDFPSDNIRKAFIM
eukprot:jgi/Galph1/4870/GphlegSOOS_G3585.1